MKLLIPLLALVASACAAADTPIATPADLRGVATNLTGSFTLTADIDLSDGDWTPIGNDATPFAGAFHGNDRKITGLRIGSGGVYAYGPGPRYFSGSQTNLPYRVLDAAQVAECSKDKEGTPWPKAKKRTSGATPISNAEDLRAVTTNLAGCYVLTRDIELNGEDWTPIGNAKTPFTGEFYGQNHRISDFKVETTEPYAGLFGNIAGGRVNGVRADGSVSRSQDTNAVVAVGGFAGVIQSKSMVDDCSFEGEVHNASGGNTGGFVGRTDDSPAILRCCAPGIWVENKSHKPNTGGFVGNHGRGFIVDAYATGEVTGFTNCVGGFAGFVDPAARIATSWCSASVETQGAWLGTFVGQVFGKGLVTDSYYDTAQYGDKLLAAGNGSAGGSNAYAGITPLDDIYAAANFKGFDFTNTWGVAEGSEAPYLMTPYDLWAKDAGVDPRADPEERVNGLSSAERYVFGIPPEAGPDDLDEPLLDVRFDANGVPYVKLPPLANTEGATVEVLSAGDLSGWSGAAASPVDPATGVSRPASGGPPPDRAFFRYRIRIGDD